MNATSELLKLQELRAKTDRQLWAIVTKALERGLISVKVARAHYELGDRALGDDLLDKAERAYDEIENLLPLLRGLTRSQRELLDDAQQALLQTLDELHELTISNEMVCCG